MKNRDAAAQLNTKQQQLDVVSTRRPKPILLPVEKRGLQGVRDEQQLNSIIFHVSKLMPERTWIYVIAI
jgi:hypothetical protein